MSRLLIVHHTTSPATQDLLESAVAATSGSEFADLEVLTRAALVAGPADVLSAQGIVLATPANIGYMSGALKHFFDTIYYPCLAETPGLPYGIWVHGNSDTSGAIRAVAGITKGLRWREVARPVTVINQVGAADRAAVADLTATVAAHASGLI